MSDPTLTAWWDFANQKTLASRYGLGPTLTCGRLLATASLVNNLGLIQTGVPANTARFDHSPIALASLGLLVEEPRSNIARQSGNLVSAPWTSIQTPAFAVNNAMSPRGILEATLITDNNAINREGIQQSISVPNTTDTHATSVFVRKTTGGMSPTFGLEMVYADGVGTVPVQIRLNTDTGVTNGVGDGGIQEFRDWWRLWGLSTNNFSGNRTLLVKVLPAVAAHGSFIDVMSTTGSAHAFGFQSEVGTFPSSYIETFGAAVLRSGDAITTTKMSWLNALAGTMFAEYTHLGVTSSANHVWTLHNNSTSLRINHHLNGLGIGRTRSNYFAANGGTIASLIDDNDLPANTISRSALAYAVNDWRAQTDGRAAVVDASGTPPVISELAVGYQGITNIQFLNGHLRKLLYYNVPKVNEFRKNLTNGLIGEASGDIMNTLRHRRGR